MPLQIKTEDSLVWNYVKNLLSKPSCPSTIHQSIILLFYLFYKACQVPGTSLPTGNVQPKQIYSLSSREYSLISKTDLQYNKYIIVFSIVFLNFVKLTEGNKNKNGKYYYKEGKKVKTTWKTFKQKTMAKLYIKMK